MLPIDGLYYWCRAHLQEAALAYNRGECRWATVDSLSTHLVVEIRKLHEQNLLALIKLPLA